MHNISTAELPLTAHGLILSSYSVLLLFKYKQHYPMLAVMDVSGSLPFKERKKSSHSELYTQYSVSLSCYYSFSPAKNCISGQLLCLLITCKQRWAPTFIHLPLFSQQREDTHFILLISVLTSLLCPPQNFDDYQYCITNKTLAEIWIRLRIFFPYPITCSLC